MRVNYQGMAFGPPGGGKTYLAAHLNRRWLLAGSHCFVHDGNRNPDFLKVGLVWYENADAWRAASRAAAKGGKAISRGALIGGDASAVVDLVNELGLRHNGHTSVRMPMRLTLDEGSAMKTSGSSWIGPKEQELITQRRHRGVGLLLLCQDGTLLHPRFKKLCTHVYIWPGLMSEDLAQLERDLSLRAPPGVTRRRGVPLVLACVDRPGFEVTGDARDRQPVIVRPGAGFTQELSDV